MSTDDSLGRTLLFIIVAVVLVTVLLPMLMMVFMMPLTGFGHMGTWNGTTGTGWSWLVPWVVLLGLVLGVGYVLARTLRAASANRPDPALEELRRAYARGDLSSEEFDERRERLEQGRDRR
ncbi:SHOCT domain-containing protein [Natronorubrum daqingense]|uniref:Putative membrane protein n=1 Tax=Natronorubrum daqingense TaxID=588898 RepID=A0A1N7EPJ1_9EURY|nr:SHOCT domain-containing protein [Natronorubrum daqingense]APX97815.1 hypothetical protein BB347_14965 [Natronorubrum daqingense]SIR90023.1 putative membrane protein [Natronorubrum daqingense]